MIERVSKSLLAACKNFGCETINSFGRDTLVSAKYFRGGPEDSGISPVIEGAETVTLSGTVYRKTDERDERGIRVYQAEPRPGYGFWTAEPESEPKQET